MPKPVAVGSRSEQDGASENGEAHSKLQTERKTVEKQQYDREVKRLARVISSAARCIPKAKPFQIAFGWVLSIALDLWCKSLRMRGVPMNEKGSVIWDY